MTKKEDGLSVSNATFEPGCRNHYHIHHATKGGRQFLLCTAGEGWYQEEEKTIKLKAGSVILIKAGNKHWHGAKKDSYFSRIAIAMPGENVSTEWLEEVSEKSIPN